MLTRHHDPVAQPAYRTGAALLLFAIAVILAALGFEYIGGYAPCPLCLQQRYAYYAGIPLLFGALVMLSADRARLAALLFALVALGFLANAALGVYHAGAEWKFWPGPDTCAAPAGRISLNARDLLDPAKKIVVVRCDEAAWRMFGVSFAGWNVLISLLVSYGAMLCARQSWSRG